VKNLKLALRSNIYGIDFSGAKNAGNRIWIAAAIISGNTIHIEDCYPASNLPGSTTERDGCLTTLRHFIGEQKTSAFGLDFPFGLPRSIVKNSNWEDFALSFDDRFKSAEEFRNTCWKAAGNHEIKRETDKKNQTPFSPYNRWLYRQTYYGIRDILAPLVQSHMACVLPMQRTSPSRTWLLEICPASTLKEMGLYQPYKGHQQDKMIGRKHILKGIEKAGISIKSSVLRAAILDNPSGDALDSIIAAFATSRAVGSLTDSNTLLTNDSLLEGYVYT